MSVTFRHAIWISLWTATFVVSTSASAQSETCVDGNGMWSATGMVTASSSVFVSVHDVSGLAEAVAVVAPHVPLAPSEVQWCVDPSDPRCSPDPAGAPSGHLHRAGELAQATVGISVPASPMRDVGYVIGLRAPITSEHVRHLERPPHAA